MPHSLTYSTLTHTCARNIYKYTHSSTVVDFMSASSMKAASPFLSLTFHFLSPSLSLSLFRSPLLSHSLLLLLTLYAILCFFAACGVGNPLLSCFVFFPFFESLFPSLDERSPLQIWLFYFLSSHLSLSLSRHVSWFQTLNLSLCLSLDPAFPMHLPAAEGYRDSSLPSFSPAPTPAPPPLPPLLHLSSSRFLTEG